MVDLLDTAASHDTLFAKAAEGADEARGPAPAPAFQPGRKVDFGQLVDRWVPLTLLVNSLNRSLGQGDAYPFALSRGALRKLQYIHEIVSEQQVPGSEAQQLGVADRPAP